LPIVRANPAEIDLLIRQLGFEHGIDARVAYDELQLRLARKSTRHSLAGG
jgi:hypothetical protein